MKLKKLALSVVAMPLFLLGGAVAHAQPAKMKIGVVVFLSGPAATFGLPARDGANLLIDALNKGQVPAPYSIKGFGGREIEVIYADEAGNTQKQLAEYRRLVEREKVDLVIGYASSANCNAVAPIAEELKVPTVLFSCGHTQLFEEVIQNPKYVVRSAPSSTMDAVGLARYIKEFRPGIKSVSGINQDYSYGKQSWAEFTGSMKALMPQVQQAVEAFPKLGAGEYGAEVSTLLRSNSDIVHSSLWGGDLSAFVLQASNRGLPAKSQLALVQGYGALDDIGEKVPVGTIIGARGPHSYLAKANPLGTWYEAAYAKAYGRRMEGGPSFITQAIFGAKAAYEKAAAAAGKTPSAEQFVQSFKQLEFPTISGLPVKMVLAGGHQAQQGTAYGEYSGWDKASKRPNFKNIRYYAAECVNPPPGKTSEAWIQSQFAGAKCD